ncbi:hypothetical protein P9423_22825 [Enterobacter mori]|uniref:hypothetical protein n=1 Tax=Enterobacter mori TaxID=539813 RepID=UPI0038917F7C
MISNKGCLIIVLLIILSIATGVVYIKSMFTNGELGAKPIYDKLQKIDDILDSDASEIKKVTFRQNAFNYGGEKYDVLIIPSIDNLHSDIILVTNKQSRNNPLAPRNVYYFPPGENIYISCEDVLKITNNKTSEINDMVKHFLESNCS